MPDSQNTRFAIPVLAPRAGLDSRAVVEQAKGIIMAERRCTAEEASDVLVKAAAHSGRGAVELAAMLVASAVRRPRALQ